MDGRSCGAPAARTPNTANLFPAEGIVAGATADEIQQIPLDVAEGLAEPGTALLLRRLERAERAIERGGAEAEWRCCFAINKE